MTPGARIAAAIDILDRWLAGEAAEKALTRWARANRYAGSKDRAAVRDHVYDAMRQRRSLAAWGGSETGRGLMLGAVRQARDPTQVFNGAPYHPEALSEHEANLPRPMNLPDPVRLDWPDWLWPQITAQLGRDRDAVLEAMQQRAPVFLRVNLVKTTPTAAIQALADEDIETQPHPLAATALLVTRNARRVAGSNAYREGLVELQDAASQAVVGFCAPQKGARVLDYCAGGGGKSLALAALSRVPVVAHDANPARMRDLPQRARRAGVQVEITQDPSADAGQFDLVLCDVPCSGSGSWRRDPQGKWRLTPEKLAALLHSQAQIIADASRLVRPGGCLAYVTCSMLPEENDNQIRDFLSAHPHWSRIAARQFTPLDGGDGFFVARLTKD